MKKRIQNAVLLPLCFLFFNASKAQTAKFTITYNDFTSEAKSAFQSAADAWANIIISSVPIKINAHFKPLQTGLLGITFPNGELNFKGAPIQNTWYVSSLANAIAGKELNPSEVDIELYLNSNVNWYYGLSGTVPGSSYDFVSVTMHEIGHGLGFLSLAKKSGATGSFGLLLTSDFAPLTTSFPWPDLDTLPSVFDRFLINNLGQKLDSFPNPGSALGLMFTGQNIFFNGSYTVAANKGVRPKMYAPPSYALGSSVTHFDETTFPSGDANEMMTPNGTPGKANHNPGPLMLGVLKDMGWDLNPASVFDMAGSDNRVGIYPNPAFNILSLINLPDKVNNPEIIITDLLGKNSVIAQKLQKNNVLDVSELKSGFYFITIKTSNELWRASFIKQ